MLKYGHLDGDAYAIGGQVIQEAGSSIQGAIRSLPQDQQNYPDMQLGGRVDRVGSPLYVSNILSHFLTVLISAVLGVVLLFWRPQFLPSLAATVETYLGQTILWGAGGMVALMLLNLFLLISLLGIPLLPLVNLVAFIVMLLGALGVVLLIGQKVLGTGDRPPLQQFLIGLLITTLGGLFPIVGGLFLLVINVLGLGAILAQQLGKLRPQVPV